MKKTSFYYLLVGLFLFSMILVACATQAGGAGVPEPTPTAKPEQAQQTFSDPFEYCAAVGTVDEPDARYTGPQITEEIINGFKVAAGLENSTMPMDIFEKTTIWRCMDNQVYACNYGANLPCSSKANVEKTPAPAMDDYCQENPDSDFIPMSVTGHSTIYSWHCVAGTPELLDQIETVDKAGYLAQIWYPIEPGAAPSTPPVEVPQVEEPAVPTETVPLPGGSSALLFSSNRGGSYTDLYLLDFSSSQVTRLTEGESNTFAGPVSPDGSRIAFTGYGLTHSYVGVMAIDGTDPVDLTQAEYDDGFPAWSPDGSQIAFTSRRDGNNEIYVMNADGTEAIRLTNNPTDDFAPSWSPDSSQIAFVSDRDRSTGIYSIYVMDADGSHVIRLTDTEGSDYTPRWSPDGTQIAFRSTLNGSSDIYAVQADGSGLVNLTNAQGDDWSPSWSPDGSLIAFQTNRDGNWEIYLMNFDGSNPRNLTQNPAEDELPYWAPLQLGMANPASTYCEQQGGKLMMEERGDMGQIGVCYFEDNRQCEEWALFRGECPVGGLKVTGYITEAARFCAITGGEYAITGSSGAEDEQGTCTFTNGKTCDVWAYYQGTCSPNE